MISKDDQQLIGPIAAFIGARLQHELPLCNRPRSGFTQSSTILVEQYKEKWWFVRIYCAMASPELVQAKWVAFGNEGDPTSDFKEACFKTDAMHYRRCHLDMVRLIPHLQHAICSQANYFELLYADATEMAREIDTLALSYSARNYGDGLAFLRQRHNVETNEQLKLKLLPIYGVRPPTID